MPITRGQLNKESKYRVTGKGYFRDGEIVTWDEDHLSNCPRVTNGTDNYFVHINNLDLVVKEPKTLFTLEVGDVVKKERGIKLVVERVIAPGFYAVKNDDGEGDYLPYAAEQLERYGYKLVTPEPEPLELTVKQVSEKYGRTVKIVD